MGCGRARLHAARERTVQGGHAHRDAAAVRLRHGAENVDVAFHPRGLGDDHHRMSALGEHLEDGAGDSEVALHRLVGVGVGSERHRGALVAGLRELRAQQRRRVGLEHEPGLEVESGRESEVRVARPRIAVDAPVLAAAVRVDGPVEGKVGRVVPGDDGAARVGREGGAELRRRKVVPVAIPIPSVVAAFRPIVTPAVVEVLSCESLEPAAGVAERAASLVDGGPPIWRHVSNLSHIRCRAEVRGQRMSASVIRRSAAAAGTDRPSAGCANHGTGSKWRPRTARRSNVKVHAHPRA